MSEACTIRWRDIDLNNGILAIECGKGGKKRRLGLGSRLVELIEDWGTQTTVSKDRLLLKDSKGRAMTRHGLYKRLVRIGEKAGVKVSPHSLRRAFVTIRANEGKPLQMLQIACGHSSIKTTMDYCRTSEQEVIEAMKGWD